MKRYQLILALVALIAALGFAGNGDLEEAEKQAKVYTDMVCAGHWPDYEGRKPQCETTKKN